MKPNTHPEYKKLKVTISEDIFETYSTYPKGEILMDIDFRKHPAWTKDYMNFVNKSNENVASFNKKFSGISFGIKK